MWNARSSLSPQRGPSEGESEYHQVGSLLCPDCDYLEFPGCGRHNSLLSSRKGNGHYQCQGCVVDRLAKDEDGEADGVGQADFLGMLLSSTEVAATDTSSPWCEQCRHCAQSRANPLTTLISDPTARRLAQAMAQENLARELHGSSASGLDGSGGNIRTVMLVCQDCHTTAFPTVNGRLLRREAPTTESAFVTQAPLILEDAGVGAGAAAEERKSTPHAASDTQAAEEDDQEVRLPADVPLNVVAEFSGRMRHYRPDCKGECIAVSILLSMTEATYCAEALAGTPRLPTDRQVVPGFLRPAAWLHSETLKRREEAEIAHNAQYLLADIQRRSLYTSHHMRRKRLRASRAAAIAVPGSDEEKVADRPSAAHAEQQQQQQQRQREEEEEDNTARVPGSSFGQPIWRDRSYTGLFGDPFVRDTELEGGSIAPSVHMLRRVLQRLQSWHPQLQQDYLPEAIVSEGDVLGGSRLVEIARLLETCGQIADEAWYVLTRDGTGGGRTPDEDEDRAAAALRRAGGAPSSRQMDTEEQQLFDAKLTAMARFLRRWKLRVALMQPGEVLLFPGGWMAPHGGHAMMHTLERSTLAEDDGASFAFTVHNTGGGLEYHPSQSVSVPADHPEKGAKLGKVKFRSTLRFRVPRHRVLDDALWLVFWRHQLFSAEEHSQHSLYQVIFPHLLGDGQRREESPGSRHTFSSVAQAALAESALHDPDFPVEWRTPQRAGTCYFKCMLQVLHYLFARAASPQPEPQLAAATGQLGLYSRALNPRQNKQLALAVRRCVLGMVWTDMQHLRRGFPADFRSDDLMLLRLSTQQCAHAAVKALGKGRLPEAAVRQLQQLIYRIERGMHELAGLRGIWNGFDPARVLLVGDDAPDAEHPRQQLQQLEEEQEQEEEEEEVQLSKLTPGSRYWLAALDREDMDVLGFGKTVEAPGAPGVPALLALPLSEDFRSSFPEEEQEVGELVLQAVDHERLQDPAAEAELEHLVEQQPFRFLVDSKDRGVQVGAEQWPGLEQLLWLDEEVSGASLGDKVDLNLGHELDWAAALQSGPPEANPQQPAEATNLFQDRAQAGGISLTLDQAVLALETVAHLCRLSEEDSRVQRLYGGGSSGNSLAGAFRRVALVEDLVLRALPLPQPEADHIWDKVADAEQQRAILRVLLELSQTYLASLLGIAQPRGAPRSDLYRVVTVAALMAVADAVLRSSRALQSPQPSLVSQVLQLGDAEGLQFFLSVATGGKESLADFTGRLLCDRPQLAVARSLVVDWFAHREQIAKTFSVSPEQVPQQQQQQQQQAPKTGALFAFPNSVMGATVTFSEDDPSLDFLRAVCLQAGWIIEVRGHARGQETRVEAEVRWLLSSTDHALVDHESHVTQLARHAPEFALYRDLAFLLHLALVPWDSGLRILPLSAWQGPDLRIRWSILPSQQSVVICVAKPMRGLGSRGLRIRSHPALELEKPRSSVRRYLPEKAGLNLGGFSALASQFGMVLPAQQPQPQGNDSAALEERVLYPEADLPTFEGLLSLEDSERLLSCLVAPYLRIPLILDYFAPRDRIGLLASSSLQGMLRAAVFEPGLWHSPTDPRTAGGCSKHQVAEFPVRPEQEPAVTSTPFGLLLQELLHSPAASLAAVSRMLGNTTALNAGSCGLPNPTPIARAVLFVVRLAVDVLEHANFAQRMLPAESTPWELLREGRKQLAVQLHTQTRSMLLGWRDQLYLQQQQQQQPLSGSAAVPEGPELVASVVSGALSMLESHLTLLHTAGLVCRELGGAEVNLPQLQVQLLGATGFVGMWHTLGAGDGANDGYQADQTLAGLDSMLMDMLRSGRGGKSAPKTATDQTQQDPWLWEGPVVLEWQVIQRMQSHRPTLLRWLAALPRDRRDAVLQQVSEYLQGWVPRLSTASPGPGPGVPEAVAVSAIVEEPLPVIYKLPGDLRLNLQTVELLFEDRQVFPIPPDIRRHSDFLRLFPQAGASGEGLGGTEDNPQHCSLQGAFKWCSRYALLTDPGAGIRYSLDWWAPATVFDEECGFPRAFGAEAGARAPELRSWRCSLDRCWAVNDRLATVCHSCNRDRPQVGGVERFGVLWPQPGGYELVFDRRYGSVRLPAEETWVAELLEPVLTEVYGEDKRGLGFSLWLPAVDFGRAGRVSLLGLDMDAGNVWKEFVVQRDSRLVEVFALRESGRRVFRSLIFSSNSRLSLHGLQPRAGDRPTPFQPAVRHAAGKLESSVRRSNSSNSSQVDSSLTIRRQLADGQQEVFVGPERLAGLLPQSLLERYNFWWRCPTAEAAEVGPEQPRVLLGELLPQLRGHSLLAECLLVLVCPRPERNPLVEVRRPLRLGSSVADPTQLLQAIPDQFEVLLQPTAAPPESGLWRAGRLLARLDDLSHVLFWGQRLDARRSRLTAIECVRLQLRFQPKYSTSDHDDGQLLAQLHCAELAGWWLAPVSYSRKRAPDDSTSQVLQSLLRGLPQSLVLTNGRRNHAVLVSGAPLRRPRVFTSPFSTELVTLRADSHWLQSLPPPHYFLFGVHRSQSVALSFADEEDALAPAQTIPIPQQQQQQQPPLGALIASSFPLIPDSLQATLYLLLSRLLNRQYAEAFYLAGCCETGGGSSAEVGLADGDGLSPAERWTCDQLQFSLGDRHPDACAVRLRLFLAMVHSGGVRWRFDQGRPWSLETEYGDYLGRLAHVSRDCRLGLQEELNLCAQPELRGRGPKAQVIQSTQIRNRHILLIALRDNKEFFELEPADRMQVQMLMGGALQVAQDNRKLAAPQTLWQQTQARAEQFFGHVWQPGAWNGTLTYERPENTHLGARERERLELERQILAAAGSAADTGVAPLQLSGVSLLRSTHRFLEDSMLGASHRLGFVFLYELVQARLSCSLLDPEEELPAELHGDSDLPLPQEVSQSLGKLLAQLSLIQAQAKAARRTAGGGGGDQLEDSTPGFGDQLVAHQIPWFVLAVISSGYCAPDRPPAAELPEHTRAARRVRNGLPVLLFKDAHDGPQFLEAHTRAEAQLRNGLPLRGLTSRVENAATEFLGQLGQLMKNFTQTLGWRQWVQQNNVLPSAPAQPKAILPESALRALAAPVFSNTACAARALPAAIMEPAEQLSFAGRLLEPLGVMEFLEFLSAEQEEQPSGRVPWDHRASASGAYRHSRVARSMLQRLESDTREFRAQWLTDRRAVLRGLQFAQIQAGVRDPEQYREGLAVLASLRERTETQIRGDSQVLLRLQSAALELANRVEVGASGADLETTRRRRRGFALRRYSGAAMLCDWKGLVHCLISDRGAADLVHLNPFLPPADATRVLELTLRAVLFGNRLGLLFQVLERAGRLQQDIRGLRTVGEASSSQLRRVALDARQLASVLLTERHFVERREDGRLELDPRFLLWEFLYDIQLRQLQVELLREFLGAASRRESRVHQMIMGAGKTTVVAPLLSLILADGRSLVTQVVPSALLPMSLAVLRSHFGVLLPRPVHTMSFDRSVSPGSGSEGPEAVGKLLGRLRELRSKSGVLICSDTSVKALLLKYLELCTEIDAPVAAIGAQQQQQRQQATLMADQLAGVAGLWQDRGVLLMDEVDLLLHPLRSELNFPVGGKHPLGPQPQRWLLPMHLLDGLRLAGSLAEGGWDPRLLPSRAMLTSMTLPNLLRGAPDFCEQLIRELRQSLLRGFREKFLQRRPHLILLDPEFYRRSLLPLLALWILLYLRSEGVATAGSVVVAAVDELPIPAWAGSTDRLLLRYLVSSPTELQTKHPATGESLLRTVRKSVTEAVAVSQAGGGSRHDAVLQHQLLQLAHDWLHSFLPHILSKVNRVNYGLLDATADIVETAGGVVAMPRENQVRQLSAVPFVGKDVPSRASEFAHPDVLVGLTALAYRKEGLRLEDVRRLMTILKDRLRQEEADELLATAEDDPAAAVAAIGTRHSIAVLCLNELQAARDSVEELRHDPESAVALPENPERRPAARLFARWLEEAAELRRRARLADWSAGQQRQVADGDSDDGKQELPEELPPLLRQASSVGVRLTRLESNPLVLSRSLSPADSGADSQAEEAALREQRLRKIVSLPQFDPTDDEQMRALHQALAWLPSAVDFYLLERVFPAIIKQHPMVLSASGQELGGDVAFGLRLGFSGTPSDLLPVALGSSHYERGSDGRVLHVLTSPEIVDCSRQPDNWSILGLLRSVAQNEPPVHALIDAGALITGLSSLEVARLLLEFGLSHCDAVVYIDEQDEQRVLSRNSSRPVPLGESGIAPERRFTFYDQIHTTGIDIGQAPDARAVLTLGKALTFRDYAQAAYRMRGLGQGQTLTLFLIPEVLKLITQANSGATRRTRGQSQRQLLVDVVHWLVLNSLRSQHIQFLQLCKQNVFNVWRRKGFRTLLDESQRALGLLEGPAGAPQAQEKALAGRLQRFTEHRRHVQDPAEDLSRNLASCLDMFRSPVDFSVPARLTERPGFGQLLQEVISQHNEYLTDEEVERVWLMSAEADSQTQSMAVQQLGEEVKQPPEELLEEEGQDEAVEQEGDGMEPLTLSRQQSEHREQTVIEDQLMEHLSALDSEMVNEQEQEQEQQRQVEVVQQRMFARTRGSQSRWQLGYAAPEEELVLALDDLMSADIPDFPFYPLRQLELAERTENQQNRRVRLRFPDYLLASRNWFGSQEHSRALGGQQQQPQAQGWMRGLQGRQAGQGDGREPHMKDVTVVMDWQLCPPQPKQTASLLTEAQRETLAQTFGLLTLGGDDPRHPKALLWGRDPAEGFTGELKDLCILLQPDANEQQSADNDNGSNNKRVTLEEFLNLQHGLGLQTEGRYYVVITLAEAQSLRALMHARHPQLLRPGLGFALRLLDGRVLDVFGDWQPAPGGDQEATALQCLRLLDAQVQFDERQVGQLLSALQHDRPMERRVFHELLGQLRHRRTGAGSGGTSRLGWLFQFRDRYEVLQHKALRVRLAWELRGFGSLLEFWQACEEHGRVELPQLWSALRWTADLGRVVLPEQLQVLLQDADRQGHGSLDFQDFAAYFGPLLQTFASLRQQPGLPGPRLPPSRFERTPLPAADVPA